VNLKREGEKETTTMEEKKMPEKNLQIIDHPNGEPRVTPPDLHVSRLEGTTMLHFANHLGGDVTVILNPLLNPSPSALLIAPSESESAQITPKEGGIFPYQVYLGRGTGGRKAKGLCDPIIIVYPPGGHT
jgi:hypothetical protein